MASPLFRFSFFCMSLVIVLVTPFVQAFHIPQTYRQWVHSTNVAPSGLLFMTGSEGGDESRVVSIKNYLKENYQGLSLILEMNDSVWKALMNGGSDGDDPASGAGSDAIGYTIFAPTAKAFQELGESKQSQLLDPRNLETSEKVGAYHVIAEPVTADQLFNAGGIITLGGELPVDRSVTGGFFGVGGKEDGGVTVGGAKVLRSITLDDGGILHETDGLVSPSILWRYMDQLRIPGSS